MPATAIPYVLWTWGMAPEGVTRVDKWGYIDANAADRAPYFYRNARRWLPQTRWEDAAYLLVRYQFNLTCLPSSKGQKWAVNDWSLPSEQQQNIVEVAYTPTGIPAAICRGALLCHLLTHDTIGGGHGRASSPAHKGT